MDAGIIILAILIFCFMQKEQQTSQAPVLETRLNPSFYEDEKAFMRCVDAVSIHHGLVDYFATNR